MDAPTQTTPENSSTLPQTQIPVQPQITPVVPKQEEVLNITTQPPQPKSGSKIILIVFLAILLIFGAAVTVAFAVAYDKLSLGNVILDKTITKVVMDLPLTPKSPEYLLIEASLAQQKITKENFVVSLAIDSGSSSQMMGLGLSKIDIEVKGDVDYTDPKNIKSNINASVTKDFNVEIRKKDTVLYFKVNKVPTTILTLIGVDTTKILPILENWVAYDTKRLETQASKYLEENKKFTLLGYDDVDKKVNEFLDPEDLKKIIISDEMLNNHGVYKLHFAPTSEMIDRWYQKVLKEAQKQSPNTTYYQFSDKNQFKLSDILGDVVSDVFVDKQTHLIRKNILSFKLKSAGTTQPNLLPQSGLLPFVGGSQSDTNVALVAEFDKFGEPFEVKTPVKSIPTEEFIKLIQETLQPKTASSSANVKGASTLPFGLLMLEQILTPPENKLRK